MESLIISELYRSVQGESRFSGLPCAFIRLTGCPLRCRWCDTSYSFKGGERLSFSHIIAEVEKFKVPYVEFTGGEPLAQKHSVRLMAEFVKLGKKVLLETSGSLLVDQVPKEVHIILDLKCPQSKMAHKNDFRNLELLKLSDEIKFVVAGREDYLWAKNLIKEKNLSERFNVLLSPVWGELDPKVLVEWLLEDELNVRLNLQIHKYIWHETKKAV